MTGGCSEEEEEEEEEEGGGGPPPLCLHPQHFSLTSHFTFCASPDYRKPVRL